MPELPEVETTVRGLNKTVRGLKIVDIWSDLPSKARFHAKKDEIKNAKFWQRFQKDVLGKKILKAERVGKNVLIHLESSNPSTSLGMNQNRSTILVHMKMTGHLLYGAYRPGKKSDGLEEHSWPWWPEKSSALQDPYNRFIRLIFKLSNGKSLAFCDSRKFGKVTLFETRESKNTKHLKDVGPDALSPKMTYKLFKEMVMKRPTGRIKNVLMDQDLIAGIGNIYSDEMLWEAGIHPEEQPENIPEAQFKKLFACMKPLLRRGINFGGDSTSDYRNIAGEPGRFQGKHNVYRRMGKPCKKRGCKGVIIRRVVGGRSAHFCPAHQQLSKAGK